MCPHCGHKKSRTTNTIDRDCFILRYKICLKCAKRFSTMERVSVFVGRATGHVEVELPPGSVEDLNPALLAPVQETEPPPAEQKPGRHAPVRFMPPDNYPLFGISEELRPLLLQWWRESRWSKHRSKANWTEAAWQASLKRVSDLCGPQRLARQRQLVEAGVEFGWQALDPKYLDPVKGMGQARPDASGRPMPRDPSMLSALESWDTVA